MVYSHCYRTEHSQTKTTNDIYGEFYNTESHTTKKVPIKSELIKVLQFIDLNYDKYFENLANLIKIKSISTELRTYKKDVNESITFIIENWLIKLGLTYERFNITSNNTNPPIILASLGNNRKKKTVCVYAHVDVKFSDPNNWRTDPWLLTEIENKIYGCGCCTGKGALISWFHMIQAFQCTNNDLPVNLKFIIGAMYYNESSHQGNFSTFLASQKDAFFSNVDNIVVCASEWIGDQHPCLVYGTVGMVHFNLFIEKTAKSKTEPKDDMDKLFSAMFDDENNILIPHFYDLVEEVTPAEEKSIESIVDYDLDHIRNSPTISAHKRHWSQLKLLMNYWRFPSVWISDANEKCTCEKRDLSTIKRHFIIKIVPRQIIENIVELITKSIKKNVKQLKIENKVDCKVLNDATTRHWYQSPNTRHYEAARRATIQIYKKNPNMIREDRSRFLLTLLDTVLEKSILLLPLGGRKSSNIEAANENITKKMFLEGTKLLAAYLYQFANLH